MHEMRIVKELFDDLLGHPEVRSSKRVTRINLRMGDFTEIDGEIVRFFFKEHSPGTPLEGAEIVIEKSPTREFTLVSFECD